MNISNKLIKSSYLTIKFKFYYYETRLIIKNKDLNVKNFHFLIGIHTDFNKNTKIQAFPKVSKKNFFDLLGKHIFVQIIFEKKPTQETYIIPKEKLEFKNEKLQLTKISESFIKKMIYLQNRVVLPLWCLSLFFAVTSFTTNFFTCFLSSISFYCFTRINIAINNNKTRIITDIYLLKNGKECEIHTFNHSFVTDIKNIRNISYEEALNTLDLINTTRNLYLPLAIDTKLYLFRIDSNIYDQIIFSAVTTGKYIKTNIYDEFDINGEKQGKDIIKM